MRYFNQHNYVRAAPFFCECALGAKQTPGHCQRRAEVSRVGFTRTTSSAVLLVEREGGGADKSKNEAERSSRTKKHRPKVRCAHFRVFFLKRGKVIKQQRLDRPLGQSTAPLFLSDSTGWIEHLGKLLLLIFRQQRLEG